MSPYADVWRPAEALLNQIEQRLSTFRKHDDNSQLLLPEVLMGPLALRFSRAAAAYYGEENRFIDDAWDVFRTAGQSTGAPKSKADAYLDRRYDSAPAYTAAGYEGRRLPKPFETVVETMRRLRDATTLKNQTAGTPSSAILGGSASYGRFYNVRGGLRGHGGDGNKVNAPSDLDLMIVLETFEVLQEFISSLRRVSFISEDSIDLALERAVGFDEIRKDKSDPVIFSHKFEAWSGELSDVAIADTGSEPRYSISLHIVDGAGFDKIIHKGEAFESGIREFIWDYRVGVPSKGMARGFDGYHEEFDHNTTPVAGGTLVRLRTFDTLGNRYKPGLHQQLILPQFEERWDASAHSIRLPLLEFKWKILDRLREEKNIHPLRQQQISLAHVRYHIFSPHIKRRVDAFENEY